jgi:ElaA protein
MQLNWQIKPYSDLSLNEFHDIIALRLKVFVVEQDCVYQDLDGKDKKCYHVLCRNGKGDIVCTARILHPGVSYPEVSIGRVVVDEQVRKYGLGHELINKCSEFIKEEFGDVSVSISAQKHLEKFYNKHHFISVGKEYLEDGIPHIEMKYLGEK